jgi:hypothetical protein
LITYPFAEIMIRGDESLDEVAEILSQEVFSGIRFSGKDLGIFDEVPAVRLEDFPLGLLVVLSGYPGKYFLLLQPTHTTSGSFGVQDLKELQISNYLATCIRGLGRWNVTTTKT